MGERFHESAKVNKAPGDLRVLAPWRFLREIKKLNRITESISERRNRRW